MAALIDFKSLPIDVKYPINKFEYDLFKTILHTDEFKCEIPFHLVHVFSIAREFWLSPKRKAYLIYRGADDLQIIDESEELKPIIEIKYLPTWVYFDVVEVTPDYVTTLYFRAMALSKYFDNELKILFWRTRKNLRVCFEYMNGKIDVHFMYSGGDPIPHVPITEIPKDLRGYEVMKFERCPNGDIVAHTQYFTCTLPDNLKNKFDTPEKFDYMNTVRVQLHFWCDSNNVRHFDLLYGYFYLT